MDLVSWHRGKFRLCQVYPGTAGKTFRCSWQRQGGLKMFKGCETPTINEQISTDCTVCTHGWGVKHLYSLWWRVVSCYTAIWGFAAGTKWVQVYLSLQAQSTTTYLASKFRSFDETIIQDHCGFKLRYTHTSEFDRDRCGFSEDKQSFSELALYWFSVFMHMVGPWSRIAVEWIAHSPRTGPCRANALGWSDPIRGTLRLALWYALLLTVPHDVLRCGCRVEITRFYWWNSILKLPLKWRLNNYRNDDQPICGMFLLSLMIQDISVPPWLRWQVEQWWYLGWRARPSMDTKTQGRPTSGWNRASFSSLAQPQLDL